MPSSSFFQLSRRVGAVGALAALSLVVLLGSPDHGSRAPTASAQPPSADDPCATIQVRIGPDVPHDVPGGSRLPPTEESDAILAAFAWQQFLALCWQSNYSDGSPTRGTPDRTWNYSQPYTRGQPLVWETFAHRSELRPAGVPLITPFNKPPKYRFVNQPAAGPGNPSFTLFNNLDEDNEIGSCDVYHGPGDPASQPLVLYQAKVNRAEYDYIKANFGPTQADPNGKLALAAKANQASIKNRRLPAPNGINLPAGDNNVPGALGEGAIEIKTAFLLVTDQNRDALKNFFQTRAIYYTADYDPGAENGQGYSNIRYHNGTFALLGIHIIHKTKSYPDFIFTSFEHVALSDMDFQYILLTPPPPQYPGSNFNPFMAKPPLGAPHATQFGDRHQIIRQTGPSPASNGELYPIPECLDKVTKTAHAALAKRNPKSVWLNYRLIGVQANITEKWAATPSENAGPNHFMANHVIESDAFLGNFFGPGFGTNPFPTGSTVPHGKKRNGDNVLYNRQTFNMGGCKGCHGVAQTAFGTDFSFLLDFHNNKPVINPDTIIYHPDEP